MMQNDKEPFDPEFEPFDMEFIYELHTIVGIDAVEEFHQYLIKNEPDKLAEFRDAVWTYYNTKYWEQKEGKPTVDLGITTIEE